MGRHPAILPDETGFSPTLQENYGTGVCRVLKTNDGKGWDLPSRGHFIFFLLLTLGYLRACNLTFCDMRSLIVPCPKIGGGVHFEEGRYRFEMDAICVGRDDMMMNISAEHETRDVPRMTFLFQPFDVHEWIVAVAMLVLDS